MSARNRIWLATLVLAACAQRPWTKQGASADQLAVDQRSCEMAATQEVQRRQSRSVSTMGPAVVGPTRRGTSPSGGPFADARGTQLADEDQLIGECMREKGYSRLRPK
jgi:hypothetical protein